MYENKVWTLIDLPNDRRALRLNGSFLEKEFLLKEVSGRKVELDEVIVPSPLLEISSSQKSVPVIPTLIREEAKMIMKH